MDSGPIRVVPCLPAHGVQWCLFLYHTLCFTQEMISFVQCLCIDSYFCLEWPHCILDEMESLWFCTNFDAMTTYRQQPALVWEDPLCDHPPCTCTAALSWPSPVYYTHHAVVMTIPHVHACTVIMRFCADSYEHACLFTLYPIRSFWMKNVSFGLYLLKY